MQTPTILPTLTTTPDPTPTATTAPTAGPSVTATPSLSVTPRPSVLTSILALSLLMSASALSTASQLDSLRTLLDAWAVPTPPAGAGTLAAGSKAEVLSVAADPSYSALQASLVQFRYLGYQVPPSTAEQQSAAAAALVLDRALILDVARAQGYSVGFLRLPFDASALAVTCACDAASLAPFLLAPNVYGVAGPSPGVLAADLSLMLDGLSGEQPRRTLHLEGAVQRVDCCAPDFQVLLPPLAIPMPSPHPSLSLGPPPIPLYP